MFRGRVMPSINFMGSSCIQRDIGPNRTVIETVNPIRILELEWYGTPIVVGLRRTKFKVTGWVISTFFPLELMATTQGMSTKDLP